MKLIMAQLSAIKLDTGSLVQISVNNIASYIIQCTGTPKCVQSAWLCSSALCPAEKPHFEQTMVSGDWEMNASCCHYPACSTEICLDRMDAAISAQQAVFLKLCPKRHPIIYIGLWPKVVQDIGNKVPFWMQLCGSLVLRQAMQVKWRELPVR